MVKPLPLPPDGVISVRRMAQIRRRHREKILKIAQRQKNRQEAAEQRRLDNIEKTTNKTETIEPKPQPEIKNDNPNSPRRILRDIQMQRLAKRKITVPIENQEYYPEKLKRKVVYKKIKLTPNQELVPLGCINKRKRRDPKKGEDYEQAINTEMPSKIAPKLAENKTRNIIREETVEEIIMRIEETDSLTDEDLVEILTCPSPVWWEQPLNQFYFDEEPINKKLQKTTHKRQNQTSIKQNKTDNKIEKLEISLKNRDQTFVTKRRTLETILSQIKDNIEPTKNSQNSSRKPTQKRPWKNLDVKNPAFGLKRNSKGRFLKKKFGSSPITISDVSDKDEAVLNNSKNPKIDSKTDLDTKTTSTKTTENNTDLADNVKDNSPNKTSESNISLNNNITKNSIKLVTNNSNDTSINTITNNFNDASINTITNNSNDTSINKITNNSNDTSINTKQSIENIDLKEKDTGDSPKALIWTSNTGECKVITFTQDSEMSSDGVEIVTESEDLEIPKEMPPLKWYPKTEIKESLETSEVSDASNDLCDGKLEYENDNVTEITNNLEEPRELDVVSQSAIGNQISNGNYSQNDEVNQTSSNKTNYDTNDNNINDIPMENGSNLTDSNETKTNQIADEKINNTDDKSTESTNKIALFGALERALNFFRKKSKDVEKGLALDGIEKDKKREDYVVVYKIDETFKDTGDDLQEELTQIGDELLERDAVSETLDDFYNNIKNGSRKVLAKEDD